MVELLFSNTCMPTCVFCVLSVLSFFDVAELAVYDILNVAFVSAPSSSVMSLVGTAPGVIHFVTHLTWSVGASCKILQMQN